MEALHLVSCDCYYTNIILPHFYITSFYPNSNENNIYMWLPSVGIVYVGM